MSRPPKTSWAVFGALVATASAIVGAVAACCTIPTRLDVPVPGDLPARVVFRTTTESFNRDYFVALRDGRIWVHPNTDVNPRAPGGWHLLGVSGLPEGDALVRFARPARVVELSADGIHLMALSEAGVFYRGDNLTSECHVDGRFNWNDRWGWPLARGDGIRSEWSTARGWSVSDSHPFGVDHYEDPNGTTHSVGLGVGHIYRLNEDGRRIHFNDWWLPNDWSRQICGPDRGTFESVNISASASTILLMGRHGQLYTRLYDFDTGGENDLLTYSYIIEGDHGTTRKLPAEPWRRQPAPEGRVTRTITIFQDGEGNAARTLRVEGQQDGRTGYFEKRIFDEGWRFVPTDLPLTAPLLPPPTADTAAGDGPTTISAPDDRRYAGTLARDGKKITLELLDFNVTCSPARARLRVDGQLVTAGGVPLELEFHHVHTLISQSRPTDYWERGAEASIKTALLLPENLTAVDGDATRKALRDLFGERKVINSLGTATKERIELKEIPWHTPFRVPAREKPMGARCETTLVLAAP